MKFTKMHGLGNDYLYVMSGTDPERPADLSRLLSDRHTGAGSDGMIWILPSDRADFRMRIFNADGSEALMCGNGIRCVGKYVYDKGYTDKTELTVETLSGIRRLSLRTENGRVTEVSVDMGTAHVSGELLLTAAGQEVVCIPVDMGNPHCVVFRDAGEVLTDELLTTVGAALEHHPAFPDGVNAEFVQVLDDCHLRMRVWERGSGITMACGTGACASAAAAVSRGLCPAGCGIAVEPDGGCLTVRVESDWSVIMTGPAVTVYEGEAEVRTCGAP